MRIQETTAGPISFRECKGRGYAATLHQVRNQCGHRVNVVITQSARDSRKTEPNSAKGLWRWVSSGRVRCGDDQVSRAKFASAHEAWINFCDVKLPQYSMADLAVSDDVLIG